MGKILKTQINTIYQLILIADTDSRKQFFFPKIEEGTSGKPELS